jgi:hypothetical protein
MRKDMKRVSIENESCKPGQLGLGFTACEHQGSPHLRWRPMRTGGMHLGAFCASCKRWLKWLPQTAEALASAPARPGA